MENSKTSQDRSLQNLSEYQHALAMREQQIAHVALPKAPKSCFLVPDAFQRRFKWINWSKLRVSPSGRVLCVFAQKDEGEIFIHLWALPEIRFIKEYRHKFDGKSSIDPLDNNTLHFIQDIDFIDDQFLALGSNMGDLIVINLKTEEIWQDCIGDMVASLRCSSRYLAVSIFPARDGRISNPNALGVTLYDIKSLKNKHFRPTIRFGYIPFSGIPNKLVFSKDQDSLFTVGHNYDRLLGDYELKLHQIDLKRKKVTFLHKIDHIGSTKSGVVHIEKQSLLLSTPKQNIEFDLSRKNIIKSSLSDIESLCLDVSDSVCSKNRDNFVYINNNWRIIKFNLSTLEYKQIANYAPRTSRLCQVPNGGVICLQLMDDRYQLQHLTTSVPHFRVPILELFRGGYDIDSQGRLSLAAANHIYRFNQGMKLQDSFESEGPIHQILSQGERLAILSFSGQVSWYEQGNLKPHLNAAGGPFNPGSGREIMLFTPQAQLYLGSSWNSNYSWKLRGNPKHLCCWHGNSRLTEWCMDEGSENLDVGISLKLLQSAKHPWKRVQLCELWTKTVLLTEDGRLLCFDFGSLMTKEEEGELNILEQKENIRQLLSKIKEPRGLSPLMGGGLALWTDSELHLLYYSESWSLLSEQRLVVQDLINVKECPLTGRLFLCHRSHLSIWSPHLAQEILRIYTLSGGVLLQAPLSKKQPGYFWYQQLGAPLSPREIPDKLLKIFKVLDQQGDEVLDLDYKRSFLARFFVPRYVQKAITDYDGFLRLVGRQQFSLPKPRRALSDLS